MEVLYEKILEKQVYLKEKGSMDSYKEIIFKILREATLMENFTQYLLEIIINDITKKIML